MAQKLRPLPTILKDLCLLLSTDTRLLIEACDCNSRDLAPPSDPHHHQPICSRTCMHTDSYTQINDKIHIFKQMDIFLHFCDLRETRPPVIFALEKKKEKAEERIKVQINKSLLRRTQYINKRRENQFLFEDSTTQKEKEEVNVSRGREWHSLTTEVGIVGTGLSIKGTGQADNII